MSHKNPGGIAPQIVLALAAAVEAKIGRPSYVRQVKNRDEWFVTDPMFSFVQHGLKKGVTGYRVGYFYSAENDSVAFYLVHSPVMAQLFKKNLLLPTLLHVIKKTAPLRSRSYLMWSSRTGRKHGYKWLRIEEESIAEFLAALQHFDNKHGFVADLFPRIENQKTGVGGGKSAGNDFYLLLAEPVSNLNENQLASFVHLSWPLFLCLYPIEAIEQRVASLARSLRAAKLPKNCEYSRINNVPSDTNIDVLCRGPIEGVHIKPHSLGGF